MLPLCKKESIALQMMRYAYSVSHNEPVDTTFLHKFFPNIPLLRPDVVPSVGLLNKISSHFQKESADDLDKILNYNNVEALGERAFSLFDVSMSKCPDIYSKIKSVLSDGESVAIHIFSPTKSESTCTHDYYNWAISGIRQWIDNPHFVVITDDEKWAKLNLPADITDYIIVPTKFHELIFEVLKFAKHNITSNRLSSWWGAWLNGNPDKIIIAPNIWDKSRKYSNLIPLYWTIIPTT